MPSRKKLLTVLLFTYNHKDTFAQSIESVLSQKTDFDFTIHVLDDHSTDGSSELALDYARRYPEKVIADINIANLGLPDNLYRGIAAVQTPYYTTLETDDYWSDDTKLQQQVDALESHPHCSICGHNTIRYDQKSQTMDEKPLHSRATGIIKNTDIKRYHEATVHPSSRMFRTSAIDYASLENADVLSWDSTSFWYFIDKGDLYYIDKVMSVYNYTYQGIYSGTNEKKRKILALTNLLDINRELGYKYNKICLKQMSRTAPLSFTERIKRLFTIKKKRQQKPHQRQLNKLVESSFPIRYYMYREFSNMGDVLNRALARQYYSNSCHADAPVANLFAIGSVLELLLSKRNRSNTLTHIWGTGFLHDKRHADEQFNRPVKIHALRGKLSKKRCEAILNTKLDDIALGDPGLLVRRFYDSSQIEKKYDVGIIPHFSDEGSELLASNIQLEQHSTVRIDVRAPLSTTLKTIASCRVIISSAMHGLIIADSLGIPNQWIEITSLDRGAGYKFRDYYSVYDIEPQAIKLSEETITDGSIEQIITDYPISSEQVDAICDQLLAKMPSIDDFPTIPISNT